MSEREQVSEKYANCNWREP